MSPRSELAIRLADVVITTNMTRPFGGDVTKSRDAQSYDILFARPAVLDGLIRVYGERFILIMCEGPAAPGAARKWREVYTTEEDASAFLRAVARNDLKTAESIPTKRVPA